MISEGLVMLAIMYANVSVPVVPDPEYLQQLYPSTTLPNNNGLLQLPGVGGVVQPTASNSGAQPTDLAGIISLAVTGGLGYFLQKQKTTTDRRTYMSADT